ncbi:hypothetical protein D1006_25820 [Burkholderia stabilis]|uniref:Uncharacterized protein n=1 Tax=Burkholderia stabilis TaxID=95485 RepID=A0A4V1PRS1_9BURK|nr:hypothetical protein D1006_25820 [Burkholderia stabilis]
MFPVLRKSSHARDATCAARRVSHGRVASVVGAVSARRSTIERMTNTDEDGIVARNECAGIEIAHRAAHACRIDTAQRPV